MRTLGLIARRALSAIPIAIGVTVITFFIVRSVPGDPARAIAGPYASAETVASIREQWDFDRPVWQQLMSHLGRMLQGDLGISAQTRNPVVDEVGSRLPATIELTLVAALIMVVLGVGLGTLAAAFNRRSIDHLARVVAILGGALPVFWLALMAQLFFYRILGWLPAVGRNTDDASAPNIVTGFNLLDSILTLNGGAFLDSLAHIVLPATTLALGGLAGITRITRSSMLEVLNTDYVRAAMARGLRWPVVVGRHALRNAMLPTVTVTGLLIGSMLGGALVVEWVFGWPGIGTYAANSITNLDYTAIMGVTLVFALAYLVVNLLVDVLYVAINPKLRQQ